MSANRWIRRDERDRREADIAEGRAMDAVFTILALILVALFAHAVIRMV